MPVTNFFWDGDNLLQEYDDGAVTTAQYSTEPGSFGNITSQRRSGQSHYYHYDPLGSTTELTDSSGTVTDTRRYEAFGETVEQSGATTFPFQYVGRSGYYIDTERSGYYIRDRDYRWDTARWLSVDRVGVVDTEFNAFAYAANNPVRFTDPAGAAYVEASPAAGERAPWCKVGSTVILEEDPASGRPVDYDPKGGLKPRIYGQTDPKYVSVDCSCRCNDVFRNSYRLSCRVVMYLQIKISPVNIKHAGRRTITVAGSYGHEQRHVQDLVQGARDAARFLGISFEAHLYHSYDSCRSIADFAEVEGQAHLDEAVRRNEAHEVPNLPATSMKPVLRGGMPVPDDCSKPGVPPDRAKDLNCCDVWLRFGPNPIP